MSDSDPLHGLDPKDPDFDRKLLALATGRHFAEMAGKPSLSQHYAESTLASSTGAGASDLDALNVNQIAELDNAGIDPEIFIEVILAGASFEDGLAAHAAGADLLGYASARAGGMNHDDALKLDVRVDENGAFVVKGSTGGDIGEQLAGVVSGDTTVEEALRGFDVSPDILAELESMLGDVSKLAGISKLGMAKRRAVASARSLWSRTTRRWYSSAVLVSALLWSR